MIDSQVVKYIKNQIKKGFSAETIKSKLVTSGHDINQIEEAYEIIKKENKKKIKPKQVLIASGVIIIIVIAIFIVIKAPKEIPKIIDNIKDYQEEKRTIAENNNEETRNDDENQPQEKDLCGGSCCVDTDCEDEDPLTRNVCSGVPKMCYDIRTEACADCEKDEISFGGSSGGDGGDGGTGGDSVPSAPVEEPPTFCSDESDCGEYETCQSGICMGIKCAQSGKNCDMDQTCDGITIITSDNYRCCMGECVLAELDCEASPEQVASLGCDPGCVECKCHTGGNYLDRNENWNAKICLLMPSISEYVWVDYPINSCPQGVTDPGCKCGEYFCGYDSWVFCQNNVCSI